MELSLAWGHWCQACKSVNSRGIPAMKKLSQGSRLVAGRAPLDGWSEDDKKDQLGAGGTWRTSRGTCKGEACQAETPVVPGSEGSWCCRGLCVRVRLVRKEQAEERENGLLGMRRRKLVASFKQKSVLVLCTLKIAKLAAVEKHKNSM